MLFIRQLMKVKGYSRLPVGWVHTHARTHTHVCMYVCMYYVCMYVRIMYVCMYVLCIYVYRSWAGIMQSV
jgi:hypothetical protein